MVLKLVNAGLVEDVSDLYNITAGDLIPLTAGKSKSAKQAEKIVNEIQFKKHRPFWRLINAPGDQVLVGEATAQLLAQHFEKLEKLMEASEEELLHVEGVGEQVAYSIVEYFQNPKNQELLRKLREGGVQEEMSKRPGGPWPARPSCSPAGSPAYPGTKPRPWSRPEGVR